MSAPNPLDAQLRALSPEATADFLGPDPGVAERLEAVYHALSRQPLPTTTGDCVLVLAGGTEQWVPLTGDTVVGTAPEAALRPASAFVSRRHCRLSAASGTWVIEDLGSKNGVLVNGQRVQRHELCSGDAIRLADVTLILVERCDPEE